MATMTVIYDESPIASVMVPTFPMDAGAALLDESTMAFIVSEDAGDRLTT